MDRRAWWATIHGVAKSQTQLRDLACTHMVRLRRSKRSSLAKDRLQKEQSRRFRSVGEAPQFSDAAELKFLAETLNRKHTFLSAKAERVHSAGPTLWGEESELC